MAKYKIIPSSRTIVQSPISIGHKAEKGVEAIEFDLTAWVETYGSGTLTVIMRRWGDAIPYPIALEIDENNKATWTLSDIDTAKAGMAYAQLSYIVGDTVVKKSDIYTFRVMDSLTGEGEPPEAYESWLEHLQHLAAEAMAEVLDIEGVATDKTLTVDGGIADAKATGDALSALEDAVTEETDKLKADLVELEGKKTYAEDVIVNFEEQSGEDVKHYSDIRTLLSGTTVNGKIWHSTNNAETTENYGKYTKYLNIGQYSALYIDGYEHGKHACAAYYDSSGNLLKTEYGTGADTIIGRFVNLLSYVPTNASYVIVNGTSEPNKTVEPKVYALNQNGTLGNLTKITGSTVEDKAFKVDGTETSGFNYCYTKYIEKPDSDYIYVSGESWSTNYPLIAFFDNTGTLISSYGTSGQTTYERVEIAIPENTFYYVVNGAKAGVKIQYAQVEYVTPGIVVTRTQADVNADVNKLIGKRYLFVGDSYGDGYSHDGSNDGWIAYAVGYLGLTQDDYISLHRGGYSFSGGTFKTLMESVTDNNITDIVVCGGYNDNKATLNTIISGISEFYQSASAKWAGVRVHIGFIAWNKAGSGEGAVSDWEQIHERLLTIVLPAYQKCATVGCQYLNNVEYWINDNKMTPSDGYHPSAAGNQSIAFAIANALKTGSAPLPYNNDLRLT